MPQLGLLLPLAAAAIAAPQAPTNLPSSGENGEMGGIFGMEMGGGGLSLGGLSKRTSFGYLYSGRLLTQFDHPKSWWWRSRSSSLII
jgi:hypothetical protein